jgi:hypothetical protein
MPRGDVTLSSPLARTARVAQVESIFDVPPSDRSEVRLAYDLPIEARPWSVGLIVGPSGCGKSTIARELWPEHGHPHEWGDRTVIDAFPDDLPVREVAGLLSSVGLGTVPAWLRPYSALSTGERFRADCARSLAAPFAVIDEYTSVVDRQVAQVASHAIQRTVRRRGSQLVAVGCHYDVIEWLQPDWTYEPDSQTFAWRALRRHPPIEITIHPVKPSVWELFRPHHYLTGNLPSGVKWVAAFVGDQPVACLSDSHVVTAARRHRDLRRFVRLVVLPEWQGLGIGPLLTNARAQQLHLEGHRVRGATASPVMRAWMDRSPRWRRLSSGSAPTAYAGASTGSRKASLRRGRGDPRLLSIASYEYQPPTDAAVSLPWLRLELGGEAGGDLVGDRPDPEAPDAGDGGGEAPRIGHHPHPRSQRPRVAAELLDGDAGADADGADDG